MTLAFGLLLPLAAGAACVFGFAPFYAWPLPVVALAALFLVWRGSGSPRQAALSGFAFGLGYFLTGVSWVFVSLHRFGDMPAILAAVATFLFCAYLALFPAAAGYLAAYGAAARSWRRMVLCAASFVATEWLRGWLFTGFPWLTLGTSQVPSGPLAGYAPYLGAYGVSLAVAGAAALLVAASLRPMRARARLVPAAAFAALFAAGVLLPQADWTQPAGAPVEVALLQGNVAQEMKWRDDVRERTLADYRRMITEARARVVIVPETALPAFLDQLPPEYLVGLLEHARTQRKEILLGTVEREFRGGDFDYYNSVVTLGEGRMQSYRKRHLVPFGEYIPTGFRWVLAVLHIPLSDFARGPAGQAPLVAAGMPLAIAICYEDLFGDEMIQALPHAQALVNVSNDAWFGESFAADQHLQASQMRALETGRWMVRATNTGASAAIDERGRIVARLEPFVAGTLVVALVPRSGATPYVRCGDAAALLLVVGFVAAAVLRARPGRGR